VIWVGFGAREDNLGHGSTINPKNSVENHTQKIPNSMEISRNGSPEKKTRMVNISTFSVHSKFI
jgi:hypothetical protein